MLKQTNRQSGRQKRGGTKVRRPIDDQFFYFSLTEKGREITLPVEEESTWDQLHDITWDPGRGD